MPSLKFCEEPKAKFDQLLFHKLVVSLTVPKSLAFRSALEWIRAYQANALQNNPFYIQQKKKGIQAQKTNKPTKTRLCIFRQTTAKTTI